MTLTLALTLPGLLSHPGRACVGGGMVVRAGDVGARASGVFWPAGAVMGPLPRARRVLV